MFRKLKSLAAAMLPLCFLGAQQSPDPSSHRAAYEKSRQQAVEMNELAGNLQSEEDARRLVDIIGEEFKAELPPRWVTRKLRHRLARAEYLSVTNPEMLVSEQQIADAWNRYVVEIRAPQEALMKAAEIHYLRDQSYVGSRLAWARGSQSIWSMPNLYAMGGDARINRDSRILEALRIMWDMSNGYESLSGVHEAVKQGVLLSDTYERALRDPESVKWKGRIQIRVGVQAQQVNPVQAAAIAYTRGRGEVAMAHAITELALGLLPPDPAR